MGLLWTLRPHFEQCRNSLIFTPISPSGEGFPVRNRPRINKLLPLRRAANTNGAQDRIGALTVAGSEPNRLCLHAAIIRLVGEVELLHRGICRLDEREEEQKHLLGLTRIGYEIVSDPCQHYRETSYL